MLKKSKPLTGRQASFQKERRSFFRQFAAEALGWAEEARGRPQMLLDDLAKLPDRVLEEMRPTYNSGGRFYISAGCLYETCQTAPDPRAVHRFNPLQEFIIDCFQGMNTLGDVAAQVHEAWDLEERESYQMVKSLFVALARLAVYLPADAHAEARDLPYDDE